MKKLCLLTFALLFTTFSWGQVVQGYNFVVTQEEFHPLGEGATLVDFSAVINLSETVFASSGIVTSENTDVPGFDLGFTVNYNGVECDHFVIYGLGAIQLGGERISVLPAANTSLMNSGLVNAFLCYNTEGTSQTENTKILYKVTGEAPNRVLTVEYSQLGLKLSSILSHEITYQISIKEDGTISYCFEEFDAGEEYYYFYIGLCGNKGEYMTLGGESIDEGKPSINANTTRINKIPGGKTLTLIPPADCVTPTAQPTNLVISTTSNQIEGSFDVSDADHYLVVYTDGSDLKDIPADGTFYATDDIIGNAKVVTYSPDPSFSLKNLQASTAYKFYVFAANSLCSKGPVYRNNSPLSLAVNTKPESPATLSATPTSPNSVTVNVTGNKAGDNVLVVYNSKLERDMNGDHAMIGKLSDIYNTGDEIEGGGKVAYAGPAKNEIVLEGLNPSTAYHFMAYCYNNKGEYSTDVVKTQSSTYITVPYETIFDDAVRNEVNAPGWTTNENTGFRVEERYAETGGDHECQYVCHSNTVATGGITNWAKMPPLVIEKSHAIMTLEYIMISVIGNSTKEAYNNWAEGDVLAIQASIDGGNTWEDVATHTSNNHPVIASMSDYVNLKADFTPYTGKTILVRIYWKTYTEAAFGTNFIINNLKLEQGELIATPVLSVANITHNTAKLSWIGTQNDYEIKFGKVGEEQTVYKATGSELVMTDLDFSSNYIATIRAVAGKGDYSEWSEPVTFTTADYPDCVAPTNLEANINNFTEDKSAVLTWVASNDHLTWEVRYRKSTDSDYKYISDLTTTTTTLTELDDEAAYLWNVRAACTYDRTTIWSSQSSFETPQCSGLSTIAVKLISIKGSNGCVNILNGPAAMIEFVEVYNADSQLVKRVTVGSTDNVMIPVDKKHGVYIVTIGLAKKKVSYKVVL